jgi:pimeloyl-ACP methyl ester carboxylesterase
MKTLPFIVQKLAFQQNNAVEIVNINAFAGPEAKIPGYFVMSNAPPNIEEAKESEPEVLEQAARGVEDIADHLHGMITTAPDEGVDLILTVHGYNTSRGSVETWYKDIFKYINCNDAAISQTGNRVFIGYRWPSENVALGNLPEVWEAFRALPPLPRDLLVTGGVAALALFIFELLTFFKPFTSLDSTGWFIATLVLAMLVALGTLMLALVVLRLVVYFRDLYRASNFGVLDLVELLRQIDRAMVERTVAEQYPNSDPTQQESHIRRAREYWQKRPDHKIKLSFIGHSMGGFVVTNVIRILSDVFDSRSIGKQPPPEIGDVFRLERLVLASPDIPVLTIISSRANFLASSLRRFSESYLFSNEGDIALRIASTAANYIAFPSKTQSRGHRLGNVALQNQFDSKRDYGVINLQALDHDFSEHLPIGAAIAQSKQKVLETLFLTYKRFQQRGVVTLADLFETQSSSHRESLTVADFFTYFDCTDYVDCKYNAKTNTYSEKTVGILTRAKTKTVLSPWDYLLLTLDYGTGKRDVHGGYFEGEFSRKLLYRLAFIGFSGYLNSLNADPQAALSELHLICQQKQIQCFLSPFRYRVSIQGGNLEGTKQELLEAIQMKDVEVLKKMEIKSEEP